MPEMAQADRDRADELVSQLERDHVQARLRGGFERDFSNSVLEQWAETGWLSEKQLHVMASIVERYTRSYECRR
jgi:hypothetical protein